MDHSHLLSPLGHPVQGPGALLHAIEQEVGTVKKMLKALKPTDRFIN
jgi:hypothetical protein